MTGLISNIEGREYRIPCPLVLGLILDQEKFHVEGGGYIYSLQKIKEGIEYKFTVGVFDEPSELISKEKDFSDVDYDFEGELYSEENQWQYKLQTFRRLEAILKEEGVI